MKFLTRWMLNFLSVFVALLVFSGILVVFDAVINRVHVSYGHDMAMWTSMGLICFGASFAVTLYFWKTRR